jgi:F-type H+-transporting ATPase subunit b
MEGPMAQQTSAHTETSGGHGGGFPPFDPSTYASQVVWLAVAFILLYALMSRLALPRMEAILKARRARISDDLAEASRSKADSEAALASYQNALADARTRAQAIATEMRDKVVAEGDQSRRMLEERLHARLSEAEEKIAATKSAAMTNVRSIAEESAAAIVRRLIGVAPPEKAVAEAVDDVLKR